MIVLRRVWILLVILIIAAGCSGLAGEPEIVATMQPTPDIEYPTTPPDLALGASIFAQHCTKCHGLTGAGDGELIGTGRNQVTVQPLSFRDPATTTDQTPLTWYQTITNGNLQQQMPPWKDALTDAERWAVAFYTFTLHNTPTNIEAGAALVTDNPVTAANLPASEKIVKLTDAELIAQVGLPEKLISGLNDQQKNDLAAYLRSLTVANPQQMGQVLTTPEVTGEPAVTPEATAERPAAGTGTVSGQVTNGTSGATVPSGLNVSLYVVDAQGAFAPLETTVDADGKFTFANIAVRADQKYIVTTTYKGRAFGSDAKDGDPTTNAVNLPLTIYETTDDASVLNILAWVSQVQLVGSSLQITDFIQIGTSGDRAYSTNIPVDDTRFVGVEVPVPPDAVIISADPGSPRYSVGADGHSVIDSAPVLPGQNYIFQMAYTLPYSGTLQVTQPVPYTLKGAYRLLLNLSGATLTSDLLKPLGPQTLSGVEYQSFGTSDSLTTADTIRYTLQGGAQAAAAPSTVNRDQVIPLVLVTIGLIIVIIAALIYWRSRRPSPVTPSAPNQDAVITDLIRQIAVLDETYRAGSLDETTYEARRKELKAQLTAHMNDEEKGE